MNFKTHLIVAIIWLLFILAVLGASIFFLVNGVWVGAASCLALVAIGARFVISDYRALFLNKTEK